MEMRCCTFKSTPNGNQRAEPLAHYSPHGFALPLRVIDYIQVFIKSAYFGATKVNNDRDLTRCTLPSPKRSTSEQDFDPSTP